MEIKGKYNTAYIKTDEVEETAISQIKELCDIEIYKKSNIVIMPDVHAGAGCVIGTTMTLDAAVTPNLVGVDIGCGVLVVPFKKGIHLDLIWLDKVIKKYIPSGMSIRNIAHEYANAIDFSKLNSINVINLQRAVNSIGTLGGGNHFIEVAVDEQKKEYLVIHSGSRNFGKQIAEYYQKIAQKEYFFDTTAEKAIIETLKAQGKQQEIEKVLQLLKNNKPSINKDLVFLTGQSFKNYLNDIKIAQEYATANRAAIAKEILDCMELTFQDIETTFSTIHNYIDLDKMILRKGAVSALKDERLIIPMNMRDGSLICTGKGNAEWNFSAPHGAGRLMSRSEAKKKITLEEVKKEMEGIYTTSLNLKTIDEAPMAYKSMENIMNKINDTVYIDKIIKPIYNFKAE